MCAYKINEVLYILSASVMLCCILWVGGLLYRTLQLSAGTIIIAHHLTLVSLAVLIQPD